MDDIKEKQRKAAIKERSEGMWLTTTSLVILAGVALAFALAYTRAVMIPFVLALFIVTIVSPILDFQVLRLKIPRIIAVTVTLIVVVAFIALAGLLVTEVVGTVASTAPDYDKVVGVLFNQGFNKFLAIVAWFEERSEDRPAEANTVTDANEPSKKPVVTKEVPTKEVPKREVPPKTETVKKETPKQLPLFSPDGTLIFEPGAPSAVGHVTPQTSATAPQVSNEMPKGKVIELLPIADGGGKAVISPKPVDIPKEPAENSKATVVELIPSGNGGVVQIPSDDPNTAALADLISETPVDPNEPRPKLFSRMDIKRYIDEFRQYILTFVQNAVGATVGIISSSVFVVIFVIFLLAGRDPRVVRGGMYADIDQKIRRYIITKMAISAVTGLLVWASLNAFGLRLAILFGVLAFLLNFIPSIGSVISTLLPIPVAIAQILIVNQDPSHSVGVKMITHNGALFLVLVVAVPGVIQFVMGSLIDPKLMGEGLNLHPVTILLALSFWGLLWGLVGMFLAAPITAAIRIILMQFDTLKPFGELLAGKLPEGNPGRG